MGRASLGDGDAGPSDERGSEASVRSAAFLEASAFLSKGGRLGPARRREVERIIAALADRGLRDVHRLAVKAIVQVA